MRVNAGWIGKLAALSYRNFGRYSKSRRGQCVYLLTRLFPNKYYDWNKLLLTNNTRSGGMYYSIANECNGCNENVLNNITILPNYRIKDSLSDLVSKCNSCGREWNEFWISYSYVTLSLIRSRQPKFTEDNEPL